MEKEINLIDCTLRDGGYYNNWDFSKKFIQEYLNSISKTKIKNIEIGFLSIPADKTKGITANCNNKFFQDLTIPKNINCGVMINGSDFLNNQLSKSEIYKILRRINKKNIRFIRFACHVYEIPKIKNYISYLKKAGFTIFVNIMQISEITKIEIKNSCNYLKNICDVIYVADSLGSLDKIKIKLILKSFREFTKKPLGVHTHDNMKKALEISISASKCDAKWIDGTIQGMGRGPGNVKTEDLIKYFFKKDINSNMYIKILSKKFLKLKKIYKWGTNSYYYLSGLYKIHPTFIQMLLSDSRYRNFNFVNVINNLKKLKAKKYNPNTLYLAMNFYNNDFTKIETQSLSIPLKKNIIIFGNGKSLQNKNIINKKLFNDSTKILINRSNYVKEKMIDLTVYCHPLRLITDLHLLKKVNGYLLLPYSSIPKILQKRIINKNVINYDLKLGPIIRLNKNHITMPKPLGLIYALGYLLSRGVKKIYIAGFDGFESNNPFKDETQDYISFLKKTFRTIKIISLTKTKLKL